MIVYNLVEYLRVELPSYSFVANGFAPDSTQDSIVVSETGGIPAHWHDRTDWTVQFLARAKEVVDARRGLGAVYDLLKNKFGLTLPEVTVDGDVHPEVKTYQFSPMQAPTYLGADNVNMEMFSFNSEVVTE